MLAIIYITEKFSVYRGNLYRFREIPIRESSNFFSCLEHENADPTIVGINW